MPQLLLMAALSNAMRNNVGMGFSGNKPNNPIGAGVKASLKWVNFLTF